MPSLDIWLAFLAATAVFAYMPGPALLYTAAQTMARGRAAGFMAALGIHLGCYLHVFAAAFGLSAVFRYVPEAYLALKLIGAGYLIWLGIGMLRRQATPADLPKLAPRTARRALLESVLVEVLNPKVAIFFIAFLPQFVDPAAALPIWAQFLVFGMIVNLAFSSADVVTVLLTDRVVRQVQRQGRAQRVARLLGGGLMVALGVRLALTRAP
jgi:threonine/homoserine/homoserine lactone efflux protein